MREYEGHVRTTEVSSFYQLKICVWLWRFPQLYLQQIRTIQFWREPMQLKINMDQIILQGTLVNQMWHSTNGKSYISKFSKIKMLFQGKRKLEWVLNFKPINWFRTRINFYYYLDIIFLDVALIILIKNII